MNFIDVYVRLLGGNDKQKAISKKLLNREISIEEAAKYL